MRESELCPCVVSHEFDGDHGLSPFCCSRQTCQFSEPVAFEPEESTVVWMSHSFKMCFVFAYLFLATASHGLLDAMTEGGLGVAFFSPFNNRRYFLPWRPVGVSPVAVLRFFAPRGFAILQSELLWIWLPAILFASLLLTLRRTSRQRQGD